jgi:predicted O-linked N-acetylglucosamine transferase (SPINDLY family)
VVANLERALQTAEQHLRAGRSADAERISRQTLADSPDDPRVVHLSGRVALQLGRLDEAAETLGRAVRADPGKAEYHLSLGEAYRLRRQFGRALDAFVQAVSLDSRLTPAHYALGLLFQDVGDAGGALVCFERAAQLQPGSPEIQRRIGAARSALAAAGGTPAPAMVALAGALDRAGRQVDALAMVQRALQIDPKLAEGHCCLGELQEAGELYDEAVLSYRRALALEPGRKSVHRSLANVLARCGRVDEAILALKEEIALQPDDPSAYSRYLMQRHYSTGYDARTLGEEARQWDVRFGRALASAIQPHDNDRSPDRRLRVGYVSPSFKQHVHSFFLIPLLAHHDHRNFEIFCYSDVEQTDGMTSIYRGHADRWLDVAGMDDERLVALIREDRIDVLVDLTMHTADGRLLAFARKPAPVQIAWLAYPGTTGLSAMDYRITDPYLDPRGSDTTVYVERSIRLPETFWCYSPLVTEASTSPLPALTNGYVRFGCLNNFAKVNDAVIALWARVLEKVPASRLVLRAPAGETRRRLLATFAQHGVRPERLELVGTQGRLPYLATYRTIDVCLDTAPCSGHTTSMDAMWMGVPVVTLVGPTVVGRAGVCLAMNVGMPDLVARTEDEYVTIAVGLVTDLQRLAQLRATLRNRMESSPLMDAPRFARNLEAAYRSAWKDWCSGQG